MDETNKTCTCKRCGHKWTARVKNPVTCPKCKSPLWNQERKISESKDSEETKTPPVQDESQKTGGIT